jgi:hypothetical protein
VDKAAGWRILKDRKHRTLGLLTGAQIRSIDRFARGLGIKALWAGGITLAQTYQFGELGVFGIYVTSAAANAVPVSQAYERDQMLAAVKEPTLEGISRAKLLLEAGFLAGRLQRRAEGKEVARLARTVIAAADADRAELGEREARLAERLLAAWVAHLAIPTGARRRVEKGEA